MMNIREARLVDLIGAQGVNLTCLAENYPMKSYWSHYMSWPGLHFIAEESSCDSKSAAFQRDDRKIVGYVLVQADESKKSILITSIAVDRSARSLGIATKLL